MAASLGGGCSQIILMCCDVPSWGPVTLGRSLKAGTTRFVLEHLGETLLRVKRPRVYLLAGDCGIWVVTEQALGTVQSPLRIFSFNFCGKTNWRAIESPFCS